MLGSDFTKAPGLGLLAGILGYATPSNDANVFTEAVFAGSGIHEEPAIAVDPNDSNHL